MTERDGRLIIATAGLESCATVVRMGEERHVFSHDGHWKLVIVDPLAHAGEEEARGGHLMAPMSGMVVAVMVKAGDKVAKGAPLMILEAMKMENHVRAPRAGKVDQLHVAAGQTVTLHALLGEIV